MKHTPESRQVDEDYVDKLLHLIRLHRQAWLTLTDEEIIHRAIYHYGGTMVEALIDTLINA